ncbi:cysteine desulfurase [Rhizobium sp. SG_E_25_P2]|uniref:cysteine desulfurase family protein n=1 Tax=Rhizobium sp. SG_E_25_P2 TaxID=2879942 RepID=UPI002473E548|nr:cysteine desulfurase family protein [Rhizobium sp. SG_E_25_P2]MDH6267142.1 cysteine desulfurase [Rhizobium sp. SG_E_25_P2]
MIRPRAYMDWNATAPLLDDAREAFLRVSLMPGNPSSVHNEGRAIRREIETARRFVAEAVGGKAANVIFTSGATEAANLVLTPEFRMGRAPLVVSRLYVSATEHKAVFDGGRFSSDAVALIPVNGDGVVDLDALLGLLDAHDKASGLPMVAVMAANNETGVLQPIADIARLTHQAGGLLVVDAVQALGRLPLDIDRLEADFLILSSHKIGGPKGAGALVARGETLMPAPLLRGGGQEKGHRSGTENAGAIAGFGAAAVRAALGVTERAAALSVLRDRIEAEMMAIAPGVVLHAKNAPRLPNTSFFSLEGLKPETGQIAFDLEGVALSAGSACSSGKVSESHVLKAMGLDPRLGALRISIGPETREDEAALFLTAFRKVASRLGKADAA